MSTMKMAVTGERVVQKTNRKIRKKTQRDNVHHEKAVTRKKIWVPEMKIKRHKRPCPP